MHRDAARRPQSAVETSEYLLALTQQSSRVWRTPALSFSLPKLPHRSFFLSAAAVAALTLVISLFSTLTGKSGAGALESDSSQIEQKSNAIALDLEELQLKLVEVATDAQADKSKPQTLGSAQPRSSAKASPFQAQVKSALSLLEQKQKIKAHQQLKDLSQLAPDDISVCVALVQTARGVRAWGEAFVAATHAVQLRGSAYDYIELAKLQKATTQGDPVASLEKALSIEPNHLRAKRLLQRYTGRKLASR